MSKAMNMSGAENRRTGVDDQLEPADELLIEDSHVAVEHQEVRPQFRHRSHELAEAGSVVDSVPADRQTCVLRLWATMRQPSTFSSYTQPARWKGGRAPLDERKRDHQHCSSSCPDQSRRGGGMIGARQH
jgi:hypothetical protein